MHNFSNVYKVLSDSPNDQIDIKFMTRFNELANADDFDPMDILKILDECAFASLASDFAMQAMHFIFEDMCKEKGLDSRKILQERNASLV